MASHDGSLGRDDATLSALVDGELAPEESRRVLEELAQDARLQARWARYHVVRAACEGAARANLRPDFSERLRDALAQEPTVVAPPARRWRQRLGKSGNALAFAASVTLVTVGGFVALQWQEGTPGGEPMVVSERGKGTSDGDLTDTALAEGAPPAPLTAATYGGTERHRMAVFLARHNEYAGAGEMPEFVPYSRLTSFNAAAR